MSWILSIIALVVALSIQGRVKHLEETVKKLSNNTNTDFSGAKVSTPENLSVATENVSSEVQYEEASVLFTPSASAPSTYVDPLTVFFRWFSIDWPMKLGAILLFLGITWLVTVVFWDTIGPVGQVTLGFVIGIAILFFGAKRIEKSSNQGSVLLGLGAGIVYFTIFAARTEYDFFTPVIALAFMLLVAVFVAFISVVQRNLPVALLGLALGGIAPLLVSFSTANTFELFSYLFILCLGTIWVVRLTGWRQLTFASLVVYALYAVPVLIMSQPTDSDQGVKMLVSIAFATLFFVASIISVIHDRNAETSDLVVSLLNGLLLLGWINMIILPEGRSFMAILVALAAVTGAFVVYTLTSLREPVYIHSAVAGVFIGMATAYELSGSMLVIAYILETTALVVGTRFWLKDETASHKAVFTAILPVILSFGSIANYSMAKELLTKDFFAILFMALMFFLLAAIFSSTEEKTSEDIGKGMLFSIAGALYTFILIWFSAHAVFSPDQATMLSLLVYTIVGMTFYIKGKIAEEKNQRIFGACLLIFVTGHLLLIDVWGMDVIGRIVTFSIIGVLFMSTAFIGRKRIE